MSHTLHALDYLAAPAKHPPAAVCVVFGDDPFLRRQALSALKAQALGGDDSPVTGYDCQERMPQWRDVIDELSTHSLFGGGGRRIVVLERADAFVSAERSRLEDYVAKPRASGMLLLDVEEWPANTRLFKAVDQSGLQIDCRPPQRQVGKNKVVDEKTIVDWIVAWGKSRHSLTVTRDAAEHLLELAGPVFGILDMDLAKLALFVDAGQKVTPELVQDAIGGWRTQSTWDLVDAAADGNAGEALVQLDRLLHAGEHPLALLGSIAWSLRRYAAATRIYAQAERRGKRIELREALSQAGFRDWPLGTIKKAEDRLKQMGRARAGKLYAWLLETDLSLKGSHSHESRGRLALEMLFLKLARKPAAAAGTRR
ncbi:MAG TPA: DNA polymerase III subunit delta [Pirellulaceae bacterium]|nr:DNA polymerase III subunit delta [Pirellulaceae bacterium]